MKMRELMIDRIRGYSWLDSCYKRGAFNAEKYSSYEEWLASLADEDLLATYNRMVEVFNGMD